MDEFYRMTPFEVASGWVPGYEEADTEALIAGTDPLVVLEELLLPALQTASCFVEFSGGRDSSALLAVAVDVARRHGLALPVPTTRVFPDVEESREEGWQEEVVRHLEISEWHRAEYTDEQDLLGPNAVGSLRQHGLIWPPTVHTRSLSWRDAAGGTIVSGEGGDEIFGLKRITPLAGLLAGNIHPRRQAITMTLVAFAPKPIRKALAAREIDKQGDRLWLRERARREFQSNLIHDLMIEPLWWDQATKAHRYRRADRLGNHNLRISAAIGGVRYLTPFHDANFLAVLANRGGRLGYPGRTAAMRDLFGHLLPPAVLERKTKAEFTRTVVRRYTRAFIESWEGDGVDNDLVDPVALKREWNAEHLHAGTLALLQATWLKLEG